MKKKTKSQIARRARLMPRGTPRWIRCYDNGGADVKGGSIDRYTVVFTGHWRGRNDNSARCIYVAMNCAPFHPQGFGQHGEHDKMIDTNQWGFAPMIGRKNHLGTRIAFSKLPTDCKKLVKRDYIQLWSL